MNAATHTFFHRKIREKVQEGKRSFATVRYVRVWINYRSSVVRWVVYPKVSPRMGGGGGGEFQYFSFILNQKGNVVEDLDGSRIKTLKLEIIKHVSEKIIY